MIHLGTRALLCSSSNASSHFREPQPLITKSELSYTFFSPSSSVLTEVLNVSPAAWPRYRVLRSLDIGQYNLEISNAQLSDDSLYECQATEAALRSRRAKLNVLSKSECNAYSQLKKNNKIIWAKDLVNLKKRKKEERHLHKVDSHISKTRSDVPCWFVFDLTYIYIYIHTYTLRKVSRSHSIAHYLKGCLCHSFSRRSPGAVHFDAAHFCCRLDLHLKSRLAHLFTVVAATGVTLRLSVTWFSNLMSKQQSKTKVLVVWCKLKGSCWMKNWLLNPSTCQSALLTCIITY